MSLETAKSAIEEYRDKMHAKKGKIVTFGKRGPVGLQIIDVLVAELEEQDQRIQALEKKLSSLKRAMLVNGRFGKRCTPQQIHELKLTARAKTPTRLIAFVSYARWSFEAPAPSNMKDTANRNPTFPRYKTRWT